MTKWSQYCCGKLGGTAEDVAFFRPKGNALGMRERFFYWQEEFV
ncbi:hypothetical protein [Megasphaera cerevisiae]|nr:hypothetical protein [Megasphaera cerevisiae]